MTIKSLLLEESYRVQMASLKSDIARIEVSMGALQAFRDQLTTRFGDILGELVDGNIQPTNAERTNFRLPIMYKGIMGSILYISFDLAIQFPDPPGTMSNTWARVSSNSLSSETKISVWLEALAERVQYVLRVKETVDALE